MLVAELIEELKKLPQDREVFTRDEYDKYIPVRHADFVESDDYGNAPHVQLSEYGATSEAD